MIRPEQHGFRRHHECLQQIYTLMEACNYRKNKTNKHSWLLFIDFKKAYDSVWQDGLFYKLAEIGVGGNILKFIRSAYRQQTSVVRTRHGPTRSFKIGKGVKQGCILSPLLFSIFINDLLRNPCWKGICTDYIDKLIGLLYADDVVITANSYKDLLAAADHVTRWCKNWKMNIGPSKCAIMKIGHATLASAYKQEHPFHTRMKPLRIQNNKISYSNHYRYLGYHLSHDLSHNLHMKILKDEIAKTSRENL